MERGGMNDDGHGDDAPETALFNTDEARVAGVIQRILGEDVTSRDQTFESLKADSLDYVEIVMEMEEEFDITIDDEEAQDITTVGGLMDLVIQKDGFK